MANDEFLVRLGKRVRYLRHKAELSQEKLGFEAGLDQTYISGIERGERNVSIKNLRAVAWALKVSLSQLLEGVD